ncbi:conserved hypothetical protein [Uncinocarpus reesii 1704]|uniref:Cytochrome P450 n=1 Tax=Uncinocarpus reesii (strain UAMH 1704) TaxID=336963 RepID=C4JV28_UNCRE|nr:uncharacterized protein UREG_04981 [Uncinocarpus reesii 1704]EEP80139.1 conserved hypothetical protein [Uncinocarpus reesii 1704]
MAASDVRLDIQPPLDGPSPPIIHITREVRRSDKVNDAYSQALDEHGPVIIVPRHGRDEYVIDHRYAHEILTDTKNFTFEKAAFDLLHLGFIALFDNGMFVRDIDSLVEKNVQPRMNAIIDRIFPVFQSYFDRMADELPNPANDKTPVECYNIFSCLQKAIGHAMVTMILGPSHSSSVTAGHFAAVAVAMANMTGMHENTHEWAWFPWLWVLLNGFKAVFFTIIPRFFFCIVPSLWKMRKQHLATGLAARHGEYVPLFDILLVKHYHEKTGFRALGGFAWCVILCVGLIFASIHQTVVAGSWILIKLAQKQDEYLPAIREEWDTVAPANEPLSVKKLSQLTLLDSFIREVFRTKGDTWGPLRQTTRPVRIGPYVLPKNAMCIVLISRAHQHPDNYGSEGKVFDGFQWQRKGRPAVQGGADFLTFGLGRWACPGRQLAIHEIKIMLYMLFSKFDIRVKDGSFRVLDTINTTSVPPEATLLLRRRQ